MEYITYIIVALVPALAVIYIVNIFLKKQGEREITNLNVNLKKERQNFFLEPRMEAYQRIVLLLERINPQSLIMRLHDPNKSAIMLQTELLSNIRNEFDHNVAQQIFISTSSWEMVKKSKEETIKIINVAAQALGEEATSIELSNKIFEIVGELDELPTEITIKLLKEELHRLF
ncbi:DUF7935 family protein [Brumimicrobium oceani]|uniref:Uncharacterized protein n=1 Tax=Brumimicrobium oceani TaxID=2100725 RepID=A0A2U2X1E0_9FLAO|nr:hypothetical protein [Brumimicrobium oceani]PWH81580.1 hypothetical protein DIT68_14735 [Brumimicrobium oceani]